MEEVTTKNTPARLSFRFDGEIQNFPDKKKLRKFSITKPGAKGMSLGRKQEKEKHYI